MERRWQHRTRAERLPIWPRADAALHSNQCGWRLFDFHIGDELNSFATFLPGYYTVAGRTYLSQPPLTMRGKAYSVYIRDGWQVNQKLTFTVGTRWEYYPLPRRETRDLQTLEGKE